MPRQLPPAPNILVFDEVLRDVTPPKPLYRTQYFHNRDPVKRHGYQFKVILLLVCLPFYPLFFFSFSFCFSLYFPLYFHLTSEYFPQLSSLFLFSPIFLLSFTFQEIRSLQIKRKAIFTLCHCIGFIHKGLYEWWVWLYKSWGLFMTSCNNKRKWLTDHNSLSCKLVPVQYREYYYGL